MMPSTEQQLVPVGQVAQQELASLVTNNSEITLALLTTGDGFEVAAYPSQQATTQRLAAMSSSLQALSDALAREAGLSNSRNLVIEADSGAIVLVGVSRAVPRLSLAVVGAAGANLGHLLWATRNCCKSLERTLTP